MSDVDTETVDPTAVEEPSHASVALVRRERRSEVMRPLDREQLTAAFAEYQKLCVDLLDESDYQEVEDGKKFKKKSAWRKLATAFDLDVEIIHRAVERDDHGRPLRAEVIARAIAPSGRYQDGDGYCSIDENRFGNSRGRAKLENDLRATATTRAKNRAISDLLGTGEASAEEVENDRGQANGSALGSSPHGKDVTGELKPFAINAVVKIVGDDETAGAALWEKVRGHFDGRMPHAAAVALVEASRAMFATPFDPQYEDPDGPVPEDAGPPDAEVVDGPHVPTEAEVAGMEDELLKLWQQAGLTGSQARKKVDDCRGRYNALVISTENVRKAIAAQDRVTA